MSAEKKINNSTCYHMSNDKNKFEENSDSFICKVTSNFMGT